MDFEVIGAIAGQELRINIRNKWILVFAAVFTALTLTIAYFGMVTAAQVGFQSFTRTSASLLNLVLYLVPLVALTMATLSFSGERGAAELLFAQPVTRLEILLGKLLGLFLSLAVATFLGFGLSGLVIGAQAGTEGAIRYTGLVLLTLLLGSVFLALGALCAVSLDGRNKTFGAALGLWFFFVLFYDLLVIGAAFLFTQRTANLLIFLSLFGNPVDLARVSSLITLGGATIFGAAGSALVKFVGGDVAGAGLLLASLVAWVAVASALSAWVLQRRDI